MSREVREQFETERRSWGSTEQPAETEESLRAKEEKKRRMDNYARLDANQFLRNGFYQDEAVASQGGDSSRFLVAAYSNWEQPLKSHTEAAAVQFYVGPPEIRPPVGKDAEILQLTKRMCSESWGIAEITDIAAITARRSMETAAGEDRASAYRADVLRLIREGGSLARSNALHAACALNDPSIVRCILQIDPTTLESRDVSNVTPLMIAAASAAGKSTINGFPRNQPVIDILIAAGADKGAVDSKGLTAYGTFKAYNKDSSQAVQAMMGRAVHTERGVPGLAELEARLMPPGGPTRADRSGGESSEQGFIDYTEEDSEYDSEFNHYGDY